MAVRHANRSSEPGGSPPTPGFAGRPPVWRIFFLLAPKLQQPCRDQPTGAGLAAELPQLSRRPVVTVDQVVEVERVDLAGVESSEAIAYLLEEPQQLLLVVSGDRLPRHATLRALTIAWRLRRSWLHRLSLPASAQPTGSTDARHSGIAPRRLGHRTSAEAASDCRFGRLHTRSRSLGRVETDRAQFPDFVEAAAVGDSSDQKRQQRACPRSGSSPSALRGWWRRRRCLASDEPGTYDVRVRLHGPPCQLARARLEL